MPPYPSKLIETAGIEIPLIGFYDAPDPAPFEPVVEPKPGARACVFAFYKSWLKGETLRVTKDNFGCGGAGRAWCGVEARSREEFIRFLVDEEGLKASHDLMNRWIDSSPPYRQKHENILVGPLRESTVRASQDGHLLRESRPARPHDARRAVSTARRRIRPR